MEGGKILCGRTVADRTLPPRRAGFGGPPNASLSGQIGTLRLDSGQPNASVSGLIGSLRLDSGRPNDSVSG